MLGSGVLYSIYGSGIALDSILGIILGFVVTAALILVLLPLAHRVGLVDHPGVTLRPKVI